MRKIAISWLLFLLGVGACSSLHSRRDTGFSQLLTDFQPAWMFEKYDLSGFTSSETTDAGGASGQRKFIGTIQAVEAGVKLSLDAVQKDATGSIVSKMEELNLSIAKVSPTALNRTTRMVVIHYEDASLHGVLVLSLEINPEGTAVTFTVLIDETRDRGGAGPEKRAK